MMKYGRDLKVFEFPAYYKTQILGAPQTETKTKTGKIKFKTLGDRERKKWSVQEVFRILSVRDDYETMAEIGSIRLCNTITSFQISLFC